MTELTSRFDEATAYALEAHRGHQRKGGTIPYASHLFAVAALALEAGGSETAAIVALLHDVVEDQGGADRLADVRERFGDEIADAVQECSAEAKTDTTEWLPRKERYIAQMRTSTPIALLVSLADKVHNLRSTLADYRQQGEAKLADFNAPDGDSIEWYYQSLADVYDERAGELPQRLRAELRRTLAQFRQLRRRPDCERCGAGDVVPIQYGYPDAELFELGEAGEVEIGGCVVDDDAPDWACRVCRHRWRDLARDRSW